MNPGFYTYLVAALAYGFFAVLLLFSWRASLQGRLLAVVAVLSGAWAVLAVYVAYLDASPMGAYQTLEILRYAAWYLFLLELFEQPAALSPTYRKFLQLALPLSLGLTVLLLADYHLGLSGRPVLGIIGQVILALVGLAILEQVFRNTSGQSRWAMKYLFLGVGGIFAYDFYLYADALLFRGLDQELWQARGLIHVLAVPMIALSAKRSKNWSVNVFVSRDIVLNTTAILGGGVYLLIMAGAGYYLREFGGSWGQVSQVVFFAFAIAVLFIVLSSTKLRAKVRVFIGKHFYENKYDYRAEWLRLTGELDKGSSGSAAYTDTITALAGIVDARAGMLWLQDEQHQYRNTVNWQTRRLEHAVPGDSSLVRFLLKTGYVINLAEIEIRPGEYNGLALPQWLEDVPSPWLIVPLRNPEGLIGFVILASPMFLRAINWEDRDLLKTAARQIASHLTVLIKSDALAQAKQFEVFSRLSAYMVHDLKNIAAELDMVAQNSERHLDNAEFLQDAFATVQLAAGDIRRLLDQLRNRRAQIEKTIRVELEPLLEKVVAAKQSKDPPPVLTAQTAGSCVQAEKGRLMNVLGHLVDNAQQATDAQGFVEIRLRSENGMHIIDICDDGVGMDADFIRNRLFRPFDTTKGNAGMGIGMYESREFVRQLGGDIRVESNPGKGTIISLHIPSDRVQDETAAHSA